MDDLIRLENMIETVGGALADTFTVNGDGVLSPNSLMQYRTYWAFWTGSSSAKCEA